MSLDVVSYSRTRTEFTLIEPGLQSALGPYPVWSQNFEFIFGRRDTEGFGYEYPSSTHTLVRLGSDNGAAAGGAISRTQNAIRPPRENVMSSTGSLISKTRCGETISAVANYRSPTTFCIACTGAMEASPRDLWLGRGGLEAPASAVLGRLPAAVTHSAVPR